MQPFAERHGLAAAMVAPTKIIAGLGASLGIDVLHVRGLHPRRSTDTNLASSAHVSVSIHKPRPCQLYRGRFRCVPLEDQDVRCQWPLKAKPSRVQTTTIVEPPAAIHTERPVLQ